MTKSTQKTYLGDGVYATCDGSQIWLSTEGALDTPNHIALEPQVLLRLLEYVHQMIPKDLLKAEGL